MKVQVLLLSLLVVFTSGCSSAKTDSVTPADPVAASDPNSKGRALLAQFSDAEDGPAWVQQNTFALSVFDKVTDPQVKSEFDAKIAPLMTKR